MPNAILKNTREKNCTLDRFVSAFVQAFETCSDTVKKYKTCSMREIRLEKEFGTSRNDKDSEVFNAWKELVGETQLAFLTADIFASFGVLPLLHLRAYTLQDATVYTRSYLYSGNFIISTVKSRYSHCFNCLELFNEDRQYPKNGRFWP